MSEHLNLNQTSSINAAWPPVPATHQRLRGFYDAGVLHTAEDVAQFEKEFQSHVAETVDDRQLGRVSIRVVASTGAVALLDGADVGLEAAIPFSRQGENFAIAYVGWNQSERRISATDFSKHRNLLQQAVKRPRDHLNPTLLLEQRGFIPQIIDARTPTELRAGLVDEFADLYAAFDYNTQDVTELLANPANTIAYIQDEGVIVSTAMAEAGSVYVAGLGDLSLVEITEAVTRAEYRGNGLYKAVSGYLTDAVLNEHNRGNRTVDVLYGESNLTMPGVINAGHENGRQFSHFDAEYFGITSNSFGILPQNFPVQDGVESRAYNDFALSYVPLS